MTEKRFFMSGYAIWDSHNDNRRVGTETAYKLLNKLHKENEQLQERNNRQAKQLDNIYHLIEKQDWKTLTGLIQEFQECEEQLQKEWECYE